MGQSDILKLLRKTKRYMSVKEIEDILKITTASHSLNKLLKQGEVIKKPILKGRYATKILWSIHG